MYPPTDFPKPTPAFQSPLPVPTNDPDEGTQWCVQFNEDYLPLVVGALLELTNQATWDTTDPDVSLLAQNRAMSRIALFQTGASCMTGILIEACDAPDCGLKYSTDGGLTWTCINLAGCIADIVGQGIDQAIQDGTLGSGPSSPPGEQPAQNTCQEYNVELEANKIWTCPVLVGEGYTVFVDHLAGYWNDGTLAWYCPDGHRMLLGACTELTSIGQAGDPLDTVPHMQLVGHFGSTWFDPLTAYDVPDGTMLSTLTIQANDGSLPDDSGKVQFHVTVCNYDPRWCICLDFTTDTPPFEHVAYPGQSWIVGTMAAGYGISGTFAGNAWLYSYWTVDTVDTFTWDRTEVEFWLDADTSGIFLNTANDDINLWGPVSLTGDAGWNIQNIGWSSTWSAGHHFWVYGALSNTSCFIRRIKFFGTGTPPTVFPSCG